MVFYEHTDTKPCEFHPKREARHNISTNLIKPIYVCTECCIRFYRANTRCKHCNVKVISETDTRAIFKREHKKDCPRYVKPERAQP